jgi:hypothetical protein
MKVTGHVFVCYGYWFGLCLLDFFSIWFWICSDIVVSFVFFISF